MTTATAECLAEKQRDPNTEFFRLWDFRCRCGCGRGRVSPELVEKLVAARLRYGGKMRINSGFRCPEHNKAVGGVEHSAHLSGEAADIGFDSGPDMWCGLQALLHAGFRRIGIGKRFIHVDVSVEQTSPAVWGY